MLQNYEKMAEPLEFMAIKEFKDKDLILKPEQKTEPNILIKLLENLEYSNTVLFSSTSPKIADINLIYKALEALIRDYCSNGPSERIKTLAFQMNEQMTIVI